MREFNQAKPSELRSRMAALMDFTYEHGDCVGQTEWCECCALIDQLVLEAARSAESSKELVQWLCDSYPESFEVQ